MYAELYAETVPAVCGKGSAGNNLDLMCGLQARNHPLPPCSQGTFRVAEKPSWIRTLYAELYPQVILMKVLKTLH